MITAAQFKKDVKHKGKLGILKSQGRIAFVIAALEAYETAVLQNLPAIQQLSYLYEIIKQGKKWLVAKGAKTSTKSLERQAHVKRLMQEAIQELALNFPDVWRALSEYNQRKAQPFQGQTVPAKGVYAHESSTYKVNKSEGKYSSPVAPRLTASATQFHNEMYLMEGRGHVAYKAFQKSALKGPIVNGALKFENLTDLQFREIDKLCQGQFNVLYLSKIQRLQYMVTVDNGLLKHPDGTLITLLAGRSVLDEINGSLYAVDKYGNMFVTTNAAHQGVLINHTTLCAGNEVLCAGTMSIKNGELRAISNNSGHYKPSTQELQQVLMLLLDAGVPMEGVVVVDNAQGNLQTMANPFTAGNFKAFPTGRINALLSKIA